VSRKSKLQRTRLDELDRRLRGFHRQGADETFVELVQERSADFYRCSAASLYGEVVDRALRRALAAGDLTRSERILRRLLREARSRPLALVAAAVGHLAAGRTEEARQALAAVAAAGGASAESGTGGSAGPAAAAAPAPLISALAALAGSSPPHAPAAPSLAAGAGAAMPQGASDLDRLGEAMATRGAGAGERSASPSLPGGAGLETSEAQAVWSFYCGLEALGAGGSPPATAEITALTRSLESLRTALGEDRALADLLADADKCLRLLAVIASAERAIRGPRRGRSGGGITGGMAPFFEVAREVSKPLLAVLRAASWHPLLEPLRRALAERWRSLLAWVSEQPDAAAGWAELYSISPPLFALDLEVGAGSSPEGGAQALRRWIQAQSVLSAQSFGELARWLALSAKNEPEPGRLVQLWALELWAWDQEEAKAEADEAAAAAPGAVRPLMSALLRLEQMAAQCRHRIPAEQQREVARILAERLVDLCTGVQFCRSMAAAPESLLLHLPDDPGLLVVGLGAAACSSNPDAGKRFAARIAARGVVDGADRERVLQLTSEVALEVTEVAVPVLRQLRPLLPDEAWAGVRSLMVREVAGRVGSSLRYGPDLDFLHLRRDLELCRTSLGDCAELAALAAAVDCIDSAAGDASHRLFQTLESLPGLEPALIAFRVLTVASTHGDRRIEEAFQECRGVTLDRLDGRWRLWQPVLVPLVVGANRRQRQRLRSMLLEARQRQGASEIDRKVYDEILAEIEVLARLERQTRRELGWALPFATDAGADAEHRRAQGAGGAGARRRTRPKAAADDQLSLEF
jgi:hypothetical protein